jgi:hypothetical protein
MMKVNVEKYYGIYTYTKSWNKTLLFSKNWLSISVNLICFDELINVHW